MSCSPLIQVQDGSESEAQLPFQIDRDWAPLIADLMYQEPCYLNDQEIEEHPATKVLVSIIESGSSPSRALINFLLRLRDLIL